MPMTEKSIVYLKTGGKRVRATVAFAKKISQRTEKRPRREIRKPAGEVTTGADLVAFWREIGVVGMRKDVKNAAEEARRLRDHAEAERKR